MSTSNIVKNLISSVKFGIKFAMAGTLSGIAGQFFGGCCRGRSIFQPYTTPYLPPPMPQMNYSSCNNTGYNYTNSGNNNSIWTAGYGYFQNTQPINFDMSLSTAPITFKGTVTKPDDKSNADLKGYNEAKGTQLVQKASVYAAMNSIVRDGIREFTDTRKEITQSLGACAFYVNTVIGNVTGVRPTGNAYEMVANLRKRNDFKEISNTTPINQIPAGAIVVYGKGVAGYSNEYGHVEIANGNGTATSDFKHDMKQDRPTAIFIPV